MLKPLNLAPDAPWRQRFRAPRWFGFQVAASAPQSGLVVSNQTGVAQLYAWQPATGALRQLSHRPEGLTGAALSPDGRYVYYLDDRQGNELGHFARFPYAAELSPQTSQDVTPELPSYSPAGIGLSQANNRLGFSAATPSGFDLHVLPLGADGALGAPQVLFHSDRLVFGPSLSHGGELAAVMSNQRSGRVEFSLIALDAATGERLGELWDGDRTSLQMARFSPVPGDMRLAATTNRSGDERLLLWNPCTGERRDLDVDGLAGSARFADWSQDGERLLFSTLSQAVQQLYVYNLAADTLTRLDHPAGTLTGATFGSGGEILVLLEDATRPARLVALDGQTGALLREVLPAAPAPAGRPWRAVHFNSSDGQRVHGWLATPEGQGPFPTIVHMIGGPTAVMVEAYHPGAQAWLDHGFAFLSVNYRGCSTFGRDFEVKIHADLGHWEVEDIVAARRYAVETGIADPDRILLTGWSYGGYLTLMGLSLYPDLWAGGMAGVAIADWAIQHEDTADMLRGIQESLLGGTPATAPEQYARSSPITYAERVKAPILIIQGRNDTRTPARPVEHYEARLKALGKPIEVEWFETGHQGSAVDIDLGLQHQERMLRFAYRVLG